MSQTIRLIDMCKTLGKRNTAIYGEVDDNYAC